MSKKVIITILIFIVCGGGLLYILKTGGPSEAKYTLNGTIAICGTGQDSVYQYSPNLASPVPQHYTLAGVSIPCSFENGIPSLSCKKFISALKDCRVIYRTNKNLRSLPGIYEAGAAQALATLQSKVH